jgi:hypothetical protein
VDQMALKVFVIACGVFVLIRILAAQATKYPVLFKVV